MNREDYLKDYYKSLEEAPLDVLEEYEGNTLAALEDYEAVGDDKKGKDLESDLKQVKDLISKSQVILSAIIALREDVRMPLPIRSSKTTLN